MSLSPESSGQRLAFALALPILGAVILSALVGTLLSGQLPSGANQTSTAVILGGVGFISLLLGMRWYGADGLGLRGKRPLYASIGFAVLGWFSFLIARFYFVSVGEFASAGAGAQFVYLFLFEGFCISLWAFGLVFRALADVRGPLTAAVTSGILFGAVAFQFFGEALFSSDLRTTSAVLYFIVWGVFYGLIRLRTGSFIGIIIVQSLHSLTGWFLMKPDLIPNPAEFQMLYLSAGIAYAIFIWRLWPTEEEDYRV